MNRSNGVIENNSTLSGLNIIRRILMFSPLHTSHGATYTCQAAINISSISLLRTANQSRHVKVQSK